MKKTNFLKGLAAKLALAVVALGAVLTSCTKEEFNIEFKPNNAQIVFNVTVIDAATNSVVTGAALSGNDAIVGNPGIAAGTATITASYNGVSGSTTINYPAVPAGSVATYSTIIMLSAEFEMENLGEEIIKQEILEGEGEHGHDFDGHLWNQNASDYYVKFTPSWSLEREMEITDSEIFVGSVALTDFIGAIEDNLTVTHDGSYETWISAWAIYRAQLTITHAKYAIAITSKATGELVGGLEITNPLYKVEYTTIEKAIPGHEGHYHYGHGHGDSSNAGGGITWAE